MHYVKSMSTENFHFSLVSFFLQHREAHSSPTNFIRIIKQDGRVAPAYFSPNYKYFDQFLQTVNNKTTALILLFKAFVPINSTLDFFTLCKRVPRFHLEKLSSHSAEKFRRGTFLCCGNFLLSKNVRDNRESGGLSRISVENFLSHSAEKFRRRTLQCFINFGYRKILCL